MRIRTVLTLAIPALVLFAVGCVSGAGTGGTSTGVVPPPPQGVVDAIGNLVGTIPNAGISGLVGAGLLWLSQILWPGSVLVPSQVKNAATAPKAP